MASSTMRSVVQRNGDAFNRRDMNAFKQNLTEDVTCKVPGNVHLQGREQVTSFYQAWIDGFPDAHVEFDLHVTDDCVIEEGTFSGTHRGTLRTPNGDIPPTGKQVSARYMEIVRTRGEQIASYELVYDRLELLEQLGLTESPARGDVQRDAGTQAAAPH